MGSDEAGLFAGVFGLIIDGPDGAVVELDGGGVSDVGIPGGGEADLPGGVPGGALVAAEAGILAEGFPAFGVDGQQAVVAEPDDVRRVAVQGGRAGRGPGCAAIGAFGLADAVGFKAVAKQDEEPAAGAFGDMAFVVREHGRALGHGEGGESTPGTAVIKGFLDGHVECFAVRFVGALSGEEDAAVLELDRPVRRGDAGANRRAPGVAVVFGADDPVALPFSAAGAGEPAHEHRAFRRPDDAGIAIVDRGVKHGHRFAPGCASVGAPDHLDLAVGGDVGAAVAGEHREQVAVGRLGDGRPPDEATGLFAQGFDGQMRPPACSKGTPSADWLPARRPGTRRPRPAAQRPDNRRRAWFRPRPSPGRWRARGRGSSRSSRR